MAPSLTHRDPDAVKMHTNTGAMAKYPNNMAGNQIVLTAMMTVVKVWAKNSMRARLSWMARVVSSTELLYDNS